MLLETDINPLATEFVAPIPRTELDSLNAIHACRSLRAVPISKSRPDANRAGNQGKAWLIADDVTYRLSCGSTLLAGVNLEVGPGEMFALVGPSGAGKTTLLRILSGELRPTTGRVRYDGYNVHAQPTAMHDRIGVVPQDDVVHGRLTVRRALSYAARLRLPSCVSTSERTERINEILTLLGIDEQADVRVDRLSGGQRKRVSIGMELITAPSLTILDEPTSGLDPAMDRQLMQALRAIAEAGRTVVIVTHNATDLDHCDGMLTLGPRGVPVYFGAPADLPGEFGTANWPEVFTKLIDEASEPPDPPEPRESQPARHTQTDAPIRPSRRRPAISQVFTLVGRHTQLIAADPGYALFLMLLPIALAGLVLAVPGTAGLLTPSPDDPSEVGQILVLLFVGAAFMGSAVSTRELIGERVIFLRERAAGLRPGAYVTAKICVFGVVCAIQTALVVATVCLAKPGPANSIVLGHGWAELGFAVWCTALASCMLGLLGSAVVRSGEQAMPLLVVMVMAQLVLCGGMIPVTGRAGLSELSWLAPSRWGYSAGASTVDLTTIMPSGVSDALWAHTGSAWFTSIAALGALATACFALCVARLTRLRRR